MRKEAVEAIVSDLRERTLRLARSIGIEEEIVTYFDGYRWRATIGTLRCAPADSEETAVRWLYHVVRRAVQGKALFAVTHRPAAAMARALATAEACAQRAIRLRAEAIDADRRAGMAEREAAAYEVFANEAYERLTPAQRTAYTALMADLGEGGGQV